MFATPRRLASLVAALTLASAPAAFADSGPKCANSDAYGSSCIAITGEGLNVRDFQAYFVPPNRDYLSHRRWAFALTRYPCDPIGKTFDECRFTKQWRSKTRRGNPPKNSSFCEILAPEGVGVQQCQDYGVGYADANFGDWPKLFALPRQLRHTTWFCSELVVRVHKQWVRNGSAGSKGLRGCAEAHD